MATATRRLVQLGIAGAVAMGAWFVWQALQPEGLPEGFAGSNGRIEAVEIDIAAKTSGRIEEIDADEGDFVSQGQILAKMDMAALEAQFREAKAQLERAKIGIDTAQAQITQQEATRQANVAVVAQREAEQEAARKQVARTRELQRRGTASIAKLDDDLARYQGAQAAVSAAKAQVAAADAALSNAKSQKIAAQAAVEAALATVDRIQTELDDSILVSPREGRVQYRVAQPGEVVSAGSTILNMVDLSDVYMTFFLPTAQAGRVAVGAEARIILDAAPQYVIPASITYVADVAQFTPKTVETADERQKLMFRLKARIPADLLREHVRQVKTGLPGMAYVRLDRTRDWPGDLQVKLPQ